MAGAYDRLDRDVQRWVRDQGWTTLRPVQEQTITAILDGNADVLVSAATAAGKTEAAFLPLLGRAARRTEPGVSILYVSPLKALINDQHERLGDLGHRLDLPIVKWHGDGPRSDKAALSRAPRGIALITPESIEAMLIRHPADARRLFAALDAIVVDELHAFLRGPRGLHLASLLARIDALAGHRGRRIGLSATLGDPDHAARWLNPDAPASVARVIAEHGRSELRLQIRGAVEPPGKASPDALSLIADHLFATLRGTNNLVFAGSRRNVELLADHLRRRSEAAGVPNAFLPHHGSLSRELREFVEARLKDGTVPTTAIATTTLELGIDIGSVASVAHLGAPRSLAGLNQRLGRSGRRDGAPASARIYVRETGLTPTSDALDRLRLPTVQAVAAVRLLLDRFIEPPPPIDPARCSVALHQVLSVIVERGGQSAVALHKAVGAVGPLAMPPGDFALLLRAMAATENGLIEQSADGTIMLAAAGEQLTESRDFYANFRTDDEWRLVTGDRPLGTIPLSNAIAIGSLLAFAGRRWRVTALDDRARLLQVVPYPAGRLPLFDSASPEPLHDRLVGEMHAVLGESDRPVYLDRAAADLLDEGRAYFRGLACGQHRFLPAGAGTHLLTWRGSDLNALLAIHLSDAGHDCAVHDIGVTLPKLPPDRAARAVRAIRADRPIEDLAMSVATLRSAKYDKYVPDALLRKAWIERNRPLSKSFDALLRDLAADM